MAGTGKRQQPSSTTRADPYLVLEPSDVRQRGEQWAHWRAGAHTAARQVVATVLAVVITVGTFWVMGVPIAFPH